MGKLPAVLTILLMLTACSGTPAGHCVYKLGPDPLANTGAAEIGGTTGGTVAGWNAGGASGAAMGGAAGGALGSLIGPIIHPVIRDIVSGNSLNHDEWQKQYDECMKEQTK